MASANLTFAGTKMLPKERILQIQLTPFVDQEMACSNLTKIICRLQKTTKNGPVSLILPICRVQKVALANLIKGTVQQKSV
jgi:hypothetical protein